MTDKSEYRKTLLASLPDDPTNATYEELHKELMKYTRQSESAEETYYEDTAKEIAGINPDGDTSEAIPILDEYIESGYQDAFATLDGPAIGEPVVEASDYLEEAIDDSIEYRSEEAELLMEHLAAARQRGHADSDVIATQMELLEALEDLEHDRELKRFIKNWRRGKPSVESRERIDLIQEYCRMVFSQLPPDASLSELVAIREHYGDANDDMWGRYRIGRMIAGCHAALGQLDDAMRALRSPAHESFDAMRRFTDFCLAFGLYEDLIQFWHANANGERHLTGGYITSQMIMAYSMLGRVQDALPYLKKRVNVRVRDQQLIDNIWSLKLRAGECPTGSEVVSLQRSKLRTFGKRNMEAVADTVDVLLEVSTSASEKSLLHLWSKECSGQKYHCNLHLISVPGVLNLSHVLPNVKERNFRYYTDIKLLRYSFNDSRRNKAFLTSLTRLGEDLTKAAGRAITAAEVNVAELRSLLRNDLVSNTKHSQIQHTIPPEYVYEPPQLDPAYRPPRENIERFETLKWLIPETYAERKSNPEAIDKTIELCREQIALENDYHHYRFLYWRYNLAQRKRNSIYYEEDPEHLRIYLEQARSYHPGPCKAYERLAIILERRKEFAQALSLAARAKSYGDNGDWDKRIARLLKHMNT